MTTVNPDETSPQLTTPDAMATVYRHGASIRLISRLSGRSFGSVHTILTNHPDVTMRPPGGAQRTTYRPR